MLITDARALPIVKTFCNDAQDWFSEFPRGATVQDAYESVPYCDWLLYVLVNTGVLSPPYEARLKRLVGLPQEHCACPTCLNDFADQQRAKDPSWNIRTMSSVRKEFPWSDVGLKLIEWMKEN